MSVCCSGVGLKARERCSRVGVRWARCSKTQRGATRPGLGPLSKVALLHLTASVPSSISYLRVSCTLVQLIFYSTTELTLSLIHSTHHCHALRPPPLPLPSLAQPVSALPSPRLSAPALRLLQHSLFNLLRESPASSSTQRDRAPSSGCAPPLACSL